MAILKNDQTHRASDDAPDRGSRPHSRSLSTTLRRLRQDGGFSIGELAERSGLAPSTLSKIENAQMSPTYETILSLAHGLDIDVSELFSHKPSTPISGRRAITRKGEGAVMTVGNYTYELLCADIANKKLVPLLTRIEARSVKEFEMLVTHTGEEFVYVLEGCVTLHTSLYATTVLNAGDSCYFDSMMGHALVSTSENPAVILWVCSNVISPLAG
ncbi:MULTISPECIES: XRE family transcriptional regulator [Agrobacterium]|uniref:Transcriptional regulator with XRE-family HTH domain n=1 Tax=Agrobacterium larrymoorei TaxID=160699 RepID=A0AAJ2B7N7_9HYPH|nr:XRE family transcriptional regulator [Agrobacterium larrymoorei]MDQ1195412.1 transcriptional regulator with XRE-family HTH domain [Rhizobium sp. SORGH_AS_0787]MDR6100920.1 transcriptional regulator with XRE-family HTH domain [Agrobacterium larrymoorei]